MSASHLCSFRMVGSNFTFFCFCICILAASVIPAANKKQDPLSDESHFEQGDHNAKYDHEAFLGEDEARRFEELPPEKAKLQLEKLLPKIDSDSDGVITEEELQNHIRFMQKRYVNKDVDRMWQNYPDLAKGDKDTLDWKKYRETVYGPESDDNPPAAEYKAMIERDERRWKVADKNEDGLLNREEYVCFMHPTEACDHMKDIVVEETTADIDKDADGFISLEEYIKDMYRPEEGETMEEPDWVKSERDMFKTYRDKDGDGKLNKEEMREWIMPTGFDHAEAEAKHLTSIADTDKDGKLTKEEILEHYDSFVGSQATDYGEQLHQHDPSEL